MQTIAVIAEFNLFHSGHAYLLQAIRGHYGPCRLVVVLSGAFVQRGEPALFDKWQRARWALSHGADCVIELPLVYAVSQADEFGRGAVRLAAALGCDALVCGVERGTADEFLALAQTALTLPPLPVNDHAGVPYGQYVTAALTKRHPRAAALLAQPNALLALSYAKAICQYAPDLTLRPIRRLGATHDAAGLGQTFASASTLRQLFCQGRLQDLAPYVPDNVYADLQKLYRDGLYTDYDRYGDAVLWANRFRTPADLRRFPAFTEGLENRWHRILQTAPTWTDALKQLKTRRYAYSRLCRMGVYTTLELTQDILTQSRTAAPAYARLLGLAPLGRPLLKDAKIRLPVITKISALPPDLSPLGRAQLALDCKGTDVQALCCHAAAGRTGQRDYVISPQILHS